MSNTPIPSPGDTNYPQNQPYIPPSDPTFPLPDLQGMPQPNNYPSYQGPHQEPPHKKPNVPLIVTLTVIACLAVVSLVAGLIYVFVAGGDDSDTTASTPPTKAEKHKKRPIEGNDKDDGKEAIRDFDFSNATWPAWGRSLSTGHSSRFSSSTQLHNGKHDEGGTPPHCFFIDSSTSPAYTDLNGDGYLDAVFPYIGTRNPGCAMGDKANKYLIGWLWDPASRTANYVDEPFIDVYSSDLTDLTIAPDPHGVKISYGVGGTAFERVAAVKNGVITTVSGYGAGGWGGSCFNSGTEAVEYALGITNVTVSPKAGSPEVDWRNARMTMGTQYPGQKLPVKDDDRLLVYLTDEDGSSPRCGWLMD